MPRIRPSQTVADLVSTHPFCIKVLQRHGIDFSRGSQRTLAEACLSRDLDPEKVVEELASAEQLADGSKTRWDELPVGVLIAHILARYHRPLDREFPRLEALVRKVQRDQGAKDPERLSKLVEAFLALRADLEPHLRREEKVLFPWILSRQSAPRQPVMVMVGEHEEASALLLRLRELTFGYQVPEHASSEWRALCQGLAALEADLHEHIYLEEKVLFPRVLAQEAARR